MKILERGREMMQNSGTQEEAGRKGVERNEEGDSVSDAFEYLPLFGTKLTQSFKELIEKRHLYQNMNISTEELKEQAPKEWTVATRGRAWQEFLKWAYGAWYPLNEIAACKPGMTPGVAAHFKIPDVKLYCSNCKRIEAYNGIACVDFLLQCIDLMEKKPEGATAQQFVFSFKCQSCKKVPEVFLIRRTGMKLKLCGRSPMEVVDVPKNIPGEVSEYYSNAVISQNAGFTLAGIMYLRTLIEQWAYLQNGGKGTAEEAMEAYMKSLPSDFKSRFKSMKELYGELSADMHAATGSSEVFERCIKEIDEHFEARRLYKIKGTGA